MLRQKRQSSAQRSFKPKLSVLPPYLYQRMVEGFVILGWAVSCFLIIALLSYHPSDPAWSRLSNPSKIANAGGRVGAWVSDVLLFGFGYWAYAFPFLLGYVAWLLYWHRLDSIDERNIHGTVLCIRTIGFVLLLLGGTALTSLYITQLTPNWLPFQSGGIVGEVVSRALLTVFNSMGTSLMLVTLFLVGITLFAGFSWFRLSEYIGECFLKLIRQLLDFIRRVTHSRALSEPIETSSRVEPSVGHSLAVPAPPKRNPVLPPKIVTKPESLKRMKINKEDRDEDSQRGMPGDFSDETPLPPLHLLDDPIPQQNIGSNPHELEERSHEVELRLADFGVNAQVVGVYPGPVVTRFELKLAAGTKVSKITTLVKDLARSFSVVSVRVVEVIPGKSVVGIELPNAVREVVSLQEVLSSKQYLNSRSALSLGLGKDIAGNPVVVDLAKMPHLLVAGTTGSGKSVGLNAMLLSFLYKATPSQLKLILIDPKMLELSIYEGIPHLLTPVVTDMKDAATALRWCVVEMERRYRLMAALGVRNIAGYNTKIKEAQDKNTPLVDRSLSVDENEPHYLDELPQIVVLADEFADMMVVVGKKVETLIARLAQKARAAGIHLILATQRPSVDVITGLIKANIPTRIAFQVSSKIDSRTILDQQGAEQLLGNGDMLYLAPGTGVPVRVHGAYVNDDEVHRVVAYLKQQGTPQYIEDVLDENLGKDTSGYTTAIGGEGDLEHDPLYDEAVHMVTKVRRVSVSSIQRRFKIGYNRAARLVEAMENAGIVSKMEGNSGQREVLAPAPIED